MKICYVINSLGAGGAERSTLELARYMRDRGHTVSLVYFKEKKIGVSKEMQSLGIDLRSVPGAGVAKWVRFVRAVRKVQPHVIHSVLLESNLAVRLGSIFLPRAVRVESLVNTPYVSIRKEDQAIGNKMSVVRAIDAMTANLFPAHYHAITQAVWAHYKQIYKRGKVSIIYRGRHAAQLKTDYSGGSPFRFLVVGRSDFQKGQWLLLEAAALLQADLSEKFQIEIAGRDGASTPRLQALVRKYALEDNVHFHGFRDDVPEWLRGGDCFVFPSLYEGLGGALIEAMATGLPCIVSDIPTFREVVGLEGNALFFPVGNAEGLAEQMRSVMLDRELRERLGKAARNRFEQAFRIEEVSKQMERMYHELLPA